MLKAKQIILIVFAFVSPALAQLPPLIDRAVSISANVRQIDRRDTIWSTSWGSFNKEFVHKRVLAVHVKALGTFDPNVTITWAFIGSDIADANRFLVFGDGKQEAIFTKNGELKFNVESPVFSGSDDKYSALGTRDREGVKPAGWAIMLWQRGRFVTGQGSTPDMLAFARKNVSPLDEKTEKKKSRTK